MTTLPSLPTMHRLHPRVQEAAWGSPSVIADLLGVEPDGGLHAELWMGDHHLAPSEVEVGSERVSLRTAVAGDPGAWTGIPGHVGGLPFLLKVLAAERPLSIQVHPTREQAAEGFAREEAAGIPVDAPHRSYRDTNHKPEMVCALTRFEALCGFRALDDTIALLQALGGAFAAWADELARGRGYRMVVAQLLTLPPGEQADLVTELRARLPTAATDPRWSAALGWVATLAGLHPDDAGVVVALLLEHVVLEPGVALFLPAGNMHAYLQGVAIEVMASSDNVLRGGLTRKHVDVAELVRVLDATPGDVPVLRGATVRDGLTEWAAPTDEFHLFRVEPARSGAGSGGVPVPVVGPGIVLCTEGSMTLERTEHDRCDLRRGEAVFVRPGAPVRVHGDGTAFCATMRPTR